MGRGWAQSPDDGSHAGPVRNGREHACGRVVVYGGRSELGDACSEDRSFRRPPVDVEGLYRTRNHHDDHNDHDNHGPADHYYYDDSTSHDHDDDHRATDHDHHDYDYYDDHHDPASLFLGAALGSGRGASPTRRR